ncbi:restriction endonuclease subunit S [Janthinobacterium agaricidamnosum]|uniref:Type I restriction modification DNA specificity domain protein n=1 Tax=Janthinobacterium agaricidamnosum NBRC 102515 = DSM 9628 TaxID=1349767 RepID=W0VEQ1_9BURK|nr:restriction endonuclease subunit S [Janthinobacterium agaricidamnosum]CDG85893.1 type I restriction modification DNA specificity domain protein [Janthinobacterium agaricidamnosum NBRC 102515 = DSM 9628]
MLPNDWKLAPLSSLASVERGKFSVRPRNDPRYFGGDVPFVQTGDVTNAGMFLRSYSQTLNGKGVLVSRVFERDTILLTIAANIGATAITVFPVACPDSVVGIKPYSDKADVLWLKYALVCRQKDLDAQASQNAQKNINLEVLRPLKLDVPPLAEQRRIGNILACWDKAIATSEQLLTNSRKKMQSLRHHLLLKPVLQARWPMLPISEISNRVQQRIDSDEVLPVLMISSACGFVRQDEKYSRFMAGKSLDNYVLLREGEFAYNKGNSKRYEFGCVYPLKSEERGLVPHVYVCFRLNPPCVLGFFEQLFAADFLHDQLGALVNTGVRNNGLLNIRPHDFLACEVPVPSIEEQMRIAETLATATKWIETQEIALDLLKQEKTALMTQLLTGKRRVALPDSETAGQP